MGRRHHCCNGCGIPVCQCAPVNPCNNWGFNNCGCNNNCNWGCNNGCNNWGNCGCNNNGLLLALMLLGGC